MPGLRRSKGNRQKLWKSSKSDVQKKDVVARNGTARSEIAGERHGTARFAKRNSTLWHGSDLARNPPAPCRGHEAVRVKLVVCFPPSVYLPPAPPKPIPEPPDPPRHFLSWGYTHAHAKGPGGPGGPLQGRRPRSGRAVRFHYTERIPGTESFALNK